MPDAPQKPQGPVAAGEDALFGAVLASVSRSFYLTIRALPAAVRRPVGLAYLLARASDTVADSAGATARERIALLDGLRDAIHGRSPAPAPERLAALEAGVADPAERALLARTSVLLDLLHATEREDRAEIVTVLDEILRGQRLDVERFSTPAGETRALANAAELDDYTYSVAGCVGEFWTRLCHRRLPGYSRKGAEETIRLGIAFGKGLQLVNILRDAPADLAQGRCYLPADELEKQGLSPGSLLSQPEKARPVFEKWTARAREHLECGFAYVEAVRPWRLRLACFLPWALGVGTLDRLERTPALESRVRIKVPRSEVRRLLVWGVLAAGSNTLLRHYAARRLPPSKEFRTS